MQLPDGKLELLEKEQVEGWNSWRYSNLSMRPCLKGLDLNRHRLQNVALWRLRMADCILDGSDLRDADMRETDFSNTSFVGADLTGAACWQSRFRFCDLRDAKLDSTNFEVYDFTGSLLPESPVSTDQTGDFYILPPWYSMQRPQPPEPPEDSIAIALLGDCTVSANYLPPSQRPCAVLAQSLAEHDSAISAFVYDLSRDGESVAGILARYESDILPVPSMDIAFIRYGVTDRKEYGADRFIQLLEQLCQKLERDFPGVQIVIETGIYVDFPEHYPFDRNVRLAPLYNRARLFAAGCSYTNSIISLCID